MPEKNQRGGAAQGHPSHGSNARTSPTTSGGAHVRIVVSLASLVRTLSSRTQAIRRPSKPPRRWSPKATDRSFEGAFGGHDRLARRRALRALAAVRLRAGPVLGFATFLVFAPIFAPLGGGVVPRGSGLAIGA